MLQSTSTTPGAGRGAAGGQAERAGCGRLKVRERERGRESARASSVLREDCLLALARPSPVFLSLVRVASDNHRSSCLAPLPGARPAPLEAPPSPRREGAGPPRRHHDRGELGLPDWCLPGLQTPRHGELLYPGGSSAAGTGQGKGLVRRRRRPSAQDERVAEAGHPDHQRAQGAD